MKRSARAPARHGKRQGGFSLTELMVAMAVGLFLLAGLGYVLLGARGSFRTLEALSRIQENARFAFETMAADIRLAGFTGGPFNGGASPVNVVNNPASGTWDRNLKDLFGTPLLGYAGGVDTFPTGVAGQTGLTGDALTIVHADADTEHALSAVAGNCSGTATCTLAVWPTSGAPAAGDIFVAADYTHAAVFQVSGVNSGARTVAHQTGTVTPGNSGDDLGVFNGDPAARKLLRLKGSTYYIATNPGGEPALYRMELTRTESGDPGHPGAKSEAAEVVEGIEDMDILYGEDVLATTGNVTPQRVSHYRAANAVADWGRVLSIRIELALVSQAGTRVTDTGDGLLRKTVTNTIAVRNRLL